MFPWYKMEKKVPDAGSSPGWDVTWYLAPSRSQPSSRLLISQFSLLITTSVRMFVSSPIQPVYRSFVRSFINPMIACFSVVLWENRPSLTRGTTLTQSALVTRTPTPGRMENRNPHPQNILRLRTLWILIRCSAKSWTKPPLRKRFSGTRLRLLTKTGPLQPRQMEVREKEPFISKERSSFV